MPQQRARFTGLADVTETDDKPEPETAKQESHAPQAVTSVPPHASVAATPTKLTGSVRGFVLPKLETDENGKPLVLKKPMSKQGSDMGVVEPARATDSPPQPAFQHVLKRSPSKPEVVAPKPEITTKPAPPSKPVPQPKRMCPCDTNICLSNLSFP